MTIEYNGKRYISVGCLTMAILKDANGKASVIVPDNCVTLFLNLLSILWRDGFLYSTQGNRVQVQLLGV